MSTTIYKKDEFKLQIRRVGATAFQASIFVNEIRRLTFVDSIKSLPTNDKEALPLIINNITEYLNGN